MNLEQHELCFGWDYGTQGATILQVGLMLEVLFMRSKTKCF